MGAQEFERSLRSWREQSGQESGPPSAAKPADAAPPPALAHHFGQAGAASVVAFLKAAFDFVTLLECVPA